MRVLEVVEPEPIPSAVPLKPTGLQGQTRQAILPNKNATKDEIDKFAQIWEPRVVNLRQRIATAFARIQKVMQPHEQALTQNIQFIVYNDAKTDSMMNAFFEHGKGVIQAEITLFWDAPDEVLLWILAHEVGHIRYRHGFNDPTAQYEKYRSRELSDPYSGYKYQYTGDASTLALVQNPKRRDEVPYTYQPDGNQVVRSEEAEANAFANDIMLRLGYKQARVFEFFHKNKQEYDAWLKRPNHNRDTGQQQIDKALKQGLQLSQPALQHLDYLMQNTA